MRYVYTIIVDILLLGAICIHDTFTSGVASRYHIWQCIWVITQLSWVSYMAKGVIYQLTTNILSSKTLTPVPRLLASWWLNYEN